MPKNIYKNKDGERVPSVTTILKQLAWGREGLLYWANNLGLKGLSHRDVRNQAADTGNYAHFAVEARVRGEAFDIDNLDIDEAEAKRVKRCLAAYDKWASQSSIQPFAAEKKVVSEAHQYGGQLDIMAMGSELAIVDIKTSKRLYDSAICQVAAYGKAWEEQTGDKVLDYIILRLSKTSGAFHCHSFPADAMEAPWRAFLACRQLHDLEKEIKEIM